MSRRSLEGTPENSLCVMGYLSQYPNVCVIRPSVASPSYTHADISIRWNQAKGDFTVPPRFWAKLKACKARFVATPFGYSCSKELGHANYMLYDKVHKTLERFDPYGKSRRKCLNPPGLDAKLTRLFRDNLGRDSIRKYYGPLDLDGKVGIQSRQEAEKAKPISSDPKAGFCLAWSCWYAGARLRWPDLSPTKTVREAEKVCLAYPSKTPLTGYIRDFSQKVLRTC